MAGFDNDVMYAINGDFSTAGAGGGSAANGLVADGKLWIGSTATNVGGTHINVGSLTSTGGTIAITYSTPNINIEAAGGMVMENIIVQTGTSPVTPTAGAITFNGATVAAGTHPVRTDGTGAHTMALEVQISQAIASTDATKIGLSNFNSAQFSVDANGFVSTSGSGVLNTLTPNSGTTPVVPTGGTISVLGTGSITTVGGTNVLTVELTGLTNHAIQIGAGTATLTQLGAGTTGQVLQTNTGADPTWSTATYPSTTTINQILYSSSNNVVAGLATANDGTLITSASGVPSIAALTDGQIIIGSSAGAPLAHTITAGTGISISNGNNSITVSATGAGFTWTDEAISFNASANNGYFVAAVATATLPALPNQGDTIAFIVDTTSTLTIQANTGQFIRVGTAISASAGTCANNARGDAITLVYRLAATTWFTEVAPQGTWTVT